MVGRLLNIVHNHRAGGRIVRRDNGGVSLCGDPFRRIGVTTKKLRRGTHTSVRQLNADIRAWIQTWNDNPRPYVWTKAADQILTSIGNYCARINDSGH